MSRQVPGSRRGGDANHARPAVEPPPDGEQSRLNRQGGWGRRVVPHPEINQYCRPTCHAYTYTHPMLHCVYMYAPVIGSDVARTTPRTPANKGRRYPAEVLTPIEIQALLDACSLQPHTELRNRAFLTTLYRTGLRCSEGPGLEPKDIDFLNTSIRVLHGKGTDPAPLASILQPSTSSMSGSSNGNVAASPEFNRCSALEPATQ
jgi:hypothetical protein